MTKFFFSTTRLRRNVHFGYFGIVFFVVLLQIPLEICVLAPSFFEECLGPFGDFMKVTVLICGSDTKKRLNLKVTIWAEAVSYCILQCFV